MESTQLKNLCRKVREDIVKMINLAGSGHPGGSLSSVEILTALYFTDILNVDPLNPSWENRDRFILSKGHVAPVLYSVLARKGFFPVDELKNLRKFGSILQGHPHMSHTPGLDCSAGSLGQGLSVANGLALAFKKLRKQQRVYCLLGDGELQEGQIWEAAMFAPQQKLDNVCAIVDFNHVQLDGTVDEIKSLDNLPARWYSFGWNVIEVDGHNVEAIYHAFKIAAATKNRPTVLIAHTVKGKGVSFMENDPFWHGNAPNAQQLESALAEIWEAKA